MAKKIMFVEEMQSDWSQKRAAMPSPQNIERAADLQRTGETVGEAEAAADNLLDGFLVVHCQARSLKIRCSFLIT